MPAKQGFGAHFIRTFGFVRKELWSIIRQPRLIMSLVVGPFLILVVFGLGYTEHTDPFRTVLVVENEDAQLAADLDDLSDAFGASIDLVGTTTDVSDGRLMLLRDEADMLIVAPTEAIETIEAGERADFTVIHTQVDPIIRKSIDLLARLSVDEINRQVLATFVASIQDTSTDVEEPVAGLSAAADSLVAALESGDTETATQEREDLGRQLDLALAQNRNDVLFEGVGKVLGGAAGSLLGEVRGDLAGTSPEDPDALENARALRDALSGLEEGLSQAQELEPELLVSPFGSQVESLRELPSSPAVFYAPGVLMLLVQHLAVTFACLSLVRERELGVTDLFRVSPLSVTEAVIGKYLAFFVIVGSLAAGLSALMLLFGVPLATAGWMYVTMVVLVILASLGLGFAISGISQTDSQAIQYAMIVLLISIFFSGFIIPLDRLLVPVHALSYLLPATYGISALQDLVFRGTSAQPALVAGLVGYALVAGLLAWLGARRDIVAAA